MKKICLILLASLLLLAGCGFNRRVKPLKGEQLREKNQYVIEKKWEKEIYYQEYHFEVFGSYSYRIVEDADIESFEVLNFKDVHDNYRKSLSADTYLAEESDLFAKDKNNLYCEGRTILTSLDLKQVKFLEPNILVDNKNVYLGPFSCYDDEIIAPKDLQGKDLNLNPKTVREVNDFIILDDTHIYMRDPNSKKKLDKCIR